VKLRKCFLCRRGKKNISGLQYVLKTERSIFICDPCWNKHRGEVAGPISKRLAEEKEDRAKKKSMKSESVEGKKIVNDDLSQMFKELDEKPGWYNTVQKKIFCSYDCALNADGIPPEIEEITEEQATEAKAEGNKCQWCSKEF